MRVEPFLFSALMLEGLVDQLVHIGALRRVVRRAGGDGGVVLERRCQFRVDLGESRILARVFHDRADRAGGETAGALGALFRIDDHEGFSIVRAGVNAIHRADIDALRVNFVHALLSNDIRHNLPPSNFALWLGRGFKPIHRKRR